MLLEEGLEPHKIGELYLNLSLNPTHYSDISAVIELKLAALGAHEATRGGRIAGLWLALAGLALGLSWLAGHPQTSYFLTWLLLAYLAFRCWQGRLGWRQSLLGGAALGMITLGVCAASLLPGVTEEYGRLLDAHRGVAQAEVTSAVPLDDEQLRRVTEILEGVVDAKVRVWAHVEPAVVGGLVARVGDRVIDGSVRARLDRMRRSVVERA